MSSNKLMKTYKSDLAPVGFYFDIFTSEIFRIPVMPIPMRIDRLFKGESTFFILPDMIKLNRLINELDLVLNMKSFLLAGIKNLINFAKNKFKEKTFLTLKPETITRWFEKSLELKTNIPSLTDDFTFLFSEFFRFYAYCENQGIDSKNEEYHSELLKYCENVFIYFKERIEQNKFEIENKNTKRFVQLYKEKKDQYYPEIVTVEVNNLKSKKKKMNFVPYLIYDDILDVFSYNKKLLSEGSKNKINLKIWSDNGIIYKRSNIEKFNPECDLTKFKLEIIDLEHLL